MHYFQRKKQECLESWALRISLVDQWLRPRVPNAGAPDSTPGQETRSHMLQLSIHMPKLKIVHAAMKIEDSVCCN